MHNMVTVTADTFEHLVAEAIDTLPQFFQTKLDNVDIVVQDWPDPATLRRAGLQHPAQLLGFYHGIPQTRRTHRYGLVLPDKISLYQRPIEMRSHTLDELRHTIQHVLRHELAHHFGLSDGRLKELGVY